MPEEVSEHENRCNNGPETVLAQSFPPTAFIVAVTSSVSTMPYEIFMTDKPGGGHARRRYRRFVVRETRTGIVPDGTFWLNIADTTVVLAARGRRYTGPEKPQSRNGQGVSIARTAAGC